MKTSFGWHYTTLGELVTYSTGGISFKKLDYTESGIPVLAKGDIKPGGRVEHGGRFFDLDQAIARRLRFTQAGDLLVTTRDLTTAADFLGLVSLAPTERPYLLNQGITAIRVDEKKVNPRYMVYWCQGSAYRGFIKGNYSGATQIHIRQSDLFRAPVMLPPRNSQDRIVSILSAYDDLIENSQRRIKILEEMARRLYREWFVHFRFPGHEGCAFVDSPLGEIPEGWEVKPICSFGRVITGKTPSKANADFYGDVVPFVKTPDMHGNMFILSTSESLSSAGAGSQSNKTLPAGTICVSCIGTIGVVSITSSECQTNQQINSVVLDGDEAREFLFHRFQDAKQTLENLGANGATMGNVNKGKFEALEILTPPFDLLADYHQLAEPIFAEIRFLSRQIQNLRRTRDLLLPRLLSGQIDVEALPEPALTEP